MKNTEALVAKLVEKALRHYAMIEPGDRILIGLSGGKDSTALAYDLALKRRWWEVPYEIAALQIVGDIPGQTTETAWLEDRMREWNIPYTRLHVPVIGRLKPGETMNCFWCATQRRTELSHFAQERGFNKIALGHHLDDILETLLMNMLRKGEFATMPPVMEYRDFPLTVIRPLALCEEKTIIDFGAEKGFLSHTCSCSFNLGGERKKTKARLEALTGGSSLAKRNLYKSMSCVKHDYLG